MLSEGLFDNVLIRPAELGCNKLCIVSGYATAAMAFHHLNILQEKNYNINIELLVGMCPKDGMPESNHASFKKIMEDDYKHRFFCSYVFNKPQVHSKVYTWFKGDVPVLGFVGSANYTQTAFYNKQRECVVSCSPQLSFNYYNDLINDSIYCTHIEAEGLVQIYKDKVYNRIQRQRHDDTTDDESLNELPNVKVSLLSKNDSMQKRSGLNWGQRPKRSRNQAYIPLKAKVYNSDFFPGIRKHFTVYTDDNKVLICTRAQENAKAIHTPHNNSLIGEYFRNRLGLASGAFITKADLLKYGRTDVTFYKIDDETYYMDFSIS